VLAVHDLHKSFGDIVALNGCEFEVPRGRMLGFLGPNGAGKTTTMRIIFGLLRPDSGRVKWDGRTPTSEDHRRFGYMPEERGLYPKMKAHDQLAYLGRLHGMTAKEASDASDVWLDRMGLTARRMDPIETLSHGNQQRVQLAASLVHDPDLLVLDEPFAGLDPIAVETMSDVLRDQAAAGKAVVFSSHQLDLVEDLCEDVAIVHQGTVVVRGTVRQLKDAAPIRHLEMEIEGEGESLLADLGGVRSIEFDGTRYTAIIAADTDVRGLLGRAQETGRVRHFAYNTPSLTDLFREAVS
jgi:ABC-2 type transport system ATP-binding protein